MQSGNDPPGQRAHVTHPAADHDRDGAIGDLSKTNSMAATAVPAPRILIVEDQALVALDLREYLTGMGMTVVGVVDSAAAAVDTAVRERPDVVLMDIRLQGERDGVDAALDLQRLDMAIVFLTAHSDRATLERVRRSAPFGYLLKPIQDYELIATIERAIQHHSREHDRPLT
jgi:DNA-binding NarL/FixJ family response regulator